MSYPGQGRANYHDARFGPVALWQLNDVLTDSVGGGGTLTLEAGTSVFCDLLPGLRGFYFDGSSALIRNASQTALQITGDLTIEFISARPVVETDKTCISHDGLTESSTDNYLYDIYLDSSFQLQYFAEQGSGTNITFGSTGFVIPPAQVVHYGMVRQANQVTFYVNGRQFGPTSSGLLAPTGGTNGKLRIGGDSAVSPVRMTGPMSSVKILNRSLTASQVAEDYNVTLGGVYGYI